MATTIISAKDACNLSQKAKECIPPGYLESINNTIQNAAKEGEYQVMIPYHPCLRDILPPLGYKIMAPHNIRLKNIMISW